MLRHSEQAAFEPGVMASIPLIPSMVPPEDPFGFKSMLETYTVTYALSHTGQAFLVSPRWQCKIPDPSSFVRMEKQNVHV